MAEGAVPRPSADLRDADVVALEGTDVVAPLRDSNVAYEDGIAPSERGSISGSARGSICLSERESVVVGIAELPEDEADGGMPEEELSDFTLVFKDKAAEQAYYASRNDQQLRVFRGTTVSLAIALGVICALQASRMFGRTDNVKDKARDMAFVSGITTAACITLGIALRVPRTSNVLMRHRPALLVAMVLFLMSNICLVNAPTRDGGTAPTAWLVMMGVPLLMEGVRSGALCMVIALAEECVRVAVAETYFLHWLPVLLPFALATGFCLFAIYMMDQRFRQVWVAQRENTARAASIQDERAQTEALLSLQLPQSILARVRQRSAGGEAEESVVAERVPCVTVVFVDIDGWQERSDEREPEEAITLLNDIFTWFDELCVLHGLEKIKTIGPVYMAACNIPEPREGHTEAVARFALALMKGWDAQAETLDIPEFGLRIGIARGEVVAGIVGELKFCYDIYGDTVNTSSRMCKFGARNRIQCTRGVADVLLASGDYKVESAGMKDFKGKGTMETFYIVDFTRRTLSRTSLKEIGVTREGMTREDLDIHASRRRTSILRAVVGSAITESARAPTTPSTAPGESLSLGTLAETGSSPVGSPQPLAATLSNTSGARANPAGGLQAPLAATLSNSSGGRAVPVVHAPDAEDDVPKSRMPSGTNYASRTTLERSGMSASREFDARKNTLGVGAEALLKAVRKVSATRSNSPPATRRTSPNTTPAVPRRKISTLSAMARSGPLKVPPVSVAGSWGSTAAIARKVSVGQNSVGPMPGPAAAPALPPLPPSWLSSFALNETARDAGRSVESVETVGVPAGTDDSTTHAPPSIFAQTIAGFPAMSSGFFTVGTSASRSTSVHAMGAQLVRKGTRGLFDSAVLPSNPRDSDAQTEEKSEPDTPAPEAPEEPKIVGQKQALASAAAEKGASSAVRQLEETKRSSFTLAFAEQALERLYCSSHAEKMRVVSLMHILCTWGALVVFLSCDVVSDASSSELRRLFYIRCAGGTALLVLATLANFLPITRTGQTRTFLFVTSFAVLSVAALLVNGSFARDWIDGEGYLTALTVFLSITTVLMATPALLFRNAVPLLVALFAVVVVLAATHWAKLNAIDTVAAWVGFVMVATQRYVFENFLRRHFILQRISATQEEELSREQALGQQLLHNILPKSVARTLAENPDARSAATARFFPAVSVLAMDICGFTLMSSGMAAQDVVSLLNDLFRRFDSLVISCKVEKICTIGDAYVAASGAPDFVPDHADRIMSLAVGMITAVSQRNQTNERQVSVRIGVHSGACFGGIMGGQLRFKYDLYGDACHVSQALEQSGTPGYIHASESTFLETSLANSMVQSITGVGISPAPPVLVTLSGSETLIAAVLIQPTEKTLRAFNLLFG